MFGIENISYRNTLVNFHLGLDFPKFCLGFCKQYNFRNISNIFKGIGRNIQGKHLFYRARCFKYNILKGSLFFFEKWLLFAPLSFCFLLKNVKAILFTLEPSFFSFRMQKASKIKRFEQFVTKRFCMPKEICSVYFSNIFLHSQNVYLPTKLFCAYWDAAK